MTESMRLAHLAERIEHLKQLKRNTKLSNSDLLESHRFLRHWTAAYHLGKIIVNIRKIDEYITILGPLWDFLKEHDLEIHSHHDRVELVKKFIHAQHSF